MKANIEMSPIVALNAIAWEALRRISSVPGMVEKLPYLHNVDAPKVLSRMVRVVDSDARTVAYIWDDAAGFIRMTIGRMGEFES